MNLSAHIDNFLEYLESDGHTSKLTIKNYRHYLQCFLEFSGQIDPLKLDLILINKYRLHLSKKPLKRITQNYFLIALRTFLRYLEKTGIKTLPAGLVKLLEVEREQLQTLENNHVRQLLDAPDTKKIDGIRDKAILETLFSTGLRVSELIFLNRDTVNLELREFKVIGKGGKTRLVFISDSAAEWLERYLFLRKDLFKPLFIRFQGKVDLSNDGEKMRLTTRSIERIVEKYSKVLHLPVKVTPQTLRHSFATDLVVSGTDIKSVQQMLGHSHISTTQIYAEKTFSPQI